MRMKARLVAVLALCVFMAAMTGCTALQPKATDSSFKPPVVTLSHVELAHYWGWWYYSKKVEPTKGTAGDYGAPLDFAFVFEIENPNPFPVKLESFSFTVGFEEFDVNSPGVIESQWIPPGKTNQLRVHAISDARQALLSLLVTGGFKLKEKGTNVWAQLESWWTKAQDFGFPITVKEGSAVFTADGVTKVSQFSAMFP